MVKVNDSETKLFNNDKGTLEFWVKPGWKAAWLPPYSGHDPHHTVNHCFVSMGPISSLHNNFQQILNVEYLQSSLWAFIGNENNVKWRTGFNLKRDKNWPGGKWHHIAFIWDAAAPRKNWIRLYVDGREKLWNGKIPKEERLSGKPTVKLNPRSPYSIQIGARNNGKFFADALIDELRISRIPRYKGNFNPQKTEFKLDNDTSALFHFNKDLNGEGKCEDGKTKIIIPGTPGVVCW